jgi:hypothetical protein
MLIRSINQTHVPRAEAGPYTEVIYHRWTSFFVCILNRGRTLYSVSFPRNCFSSGGSANITITMIAKKIKFQKLWTTIQEKIFNFPYPIWKHKDVGP